MPFAPSPTLRQWLVAEGGAAPFRRFMEAALYDPHFGYYTTQIRTVGARGDFSTTATLSPALARAVAAWVVREATPDCRDLIEIGPGSGALHLALRRALGWRARCRWRSHLVERSPALQAEQQRRLGRWHRRVHWHASPADALLAAGGNAMIFSNELVDAFPVTLLQQHENAWQEVWLELTSEGRLIEALRPYQGPLPHLDPKRLAEGQRVEFHHAYHTWGQTWRPAWRRGAMLTIDYGDTADRLYHRRPQGTLRGYAHHRVLHGLELYGPLGQSDLTADVNFTDLMERGAELRLETVRLSSQAEFLADFIDPQCPTDQRLQDPHGAGGAFYCLMQRPY